MAIYPGQGTILQGTIANNSTAMFQIVELDGPTAEIGTKEITNLGDVVKKYRAQLPDMGEVTGTGQLDPANNTHQNLFTLINTWPQAASTWKVIWPTVNNSTVSFSGIFTKLSPKGMNEDDNLEFDFSIKITGLNTWPTN